MRNRVPLSYPLAALRAEMRSRPGHGALHGFFYSTAYPREQFCRTVKGFSAERFNFDKTHQYPSNVLRSLTCVV